MTLFQKKPITGLHIFGEIWSSNESCLIDLVATRTKVLTLIESAGLGVVGIAEHNFFPTNGFTFVALLSESHVSIHTWPELGYVTIDTYVCNISKDNSDNARKLFTNIVELFEPTKIIRREVSR